MKEDLLLVFFIIVLIKKLVWSMYVCTVYLAFFCVHLFALTL